MPHDLIAGPVRHRRVFDSNGGVRLSGDEASIRREGFYYVGDERIVAMFGSTMPAELADIVDIAVAAYIADRVSPRCSPHADRYHHHWARRFAITLPVRNPDRWSDRTLYGTLRNVLAFYTDDDWQFDFVPRSTYRRSECQPALFAERSEPPVTAALFSGGLDSLAGLCSMLEERQHHSFVLFSGSTNHRTAAIQRRLVRAVSAQWPGAIAHVTVPFGLHRGSRRYNDDEPTQRTRGLVFLALGAVTAMMAGADSLEVYENGIGAINLPYTEAQLGTHSTRATHPLALTMMSGLISGAAERHFVFRSPFLFHTKGELCAPLSTYGLGELVGQTVSCDGFPQRIPDRPQCGICTSCLLRRQALHAARLGAYDRADGYRYDVLNPGAQTPVGKLYPLQAMLNQVAEIRLALATPNPWGSLSSLYPQLFEVVAAANVVGGELASAESQVVELYRRYCEEWMHLPLSLPGWPVPHAA